MVRRPMSRPQPRCRAKPSRETSVPDGIDRLGPAAWRGEWQAVIHRVLLVGSYAFTPQLIERSPLSAYITETPCLASVADHNMDCYS